MKQRENVFVKSFDFKKFSVDAIPDTAAQKHDLRR